MNPVYLNYNINKRYFTKYIIDKKITLDYTIHKRKFRDYNY